MESNKPSGADEIDLGQLFRSIVAGFKNFGNSVLRGVASIRRLFISNLIFFGIVIICGLTLASIYFFSFRKSHFSSSMIISCSYLNMRIVENTIDKLNQLCKEDDRDGLAQVLSIDRNTALNIRRFDAQNFVSENDRIEIEVLKAQLANVAADKKDLVNKIIGKIEIGNRQSYLISISVFNPDIVRELDSAVVNYFRDNSFVKKRMESNRANLLQRKFKLVKESKKLDSLKSVLFANFQTMAKQSREGSNNVILGDKYLTDPIDVYKEDLTINNEILAIDELLYIRPDFEVVDGLTTYRAPSNLSLPIVLLVAFSGSIIIGYIILGIWKFNQFLGTIG